MTIRTRDGELVDQDDATTPWHDPRCYTGWLPSTTDERPVPCLVCRPNVARAQEYLRRQRLRTHRRASPHVQAEAMATIRAEIARARHRTARSTVSPASSTPTPGRTP